MGVLADYLRSEAEQIRAGAARRQDDLDEWTSAVYRLYDQLELWLEEADGGLGLIGTHRQTTVKDISEPRLGHYSVKIMWVFLGGSFGERKAVIAPKARYVAGVIRPPGREPRRADGMAQIDELSSPEYYLFRWKSDSGDEWFIRDANAWDSRPGDYAVEPLDRDRFEAAILRVLQ